MGGSHGSQCGLLLQRWDGWQCRSSHDTREPRARCGTMYNCTETKTSLRCRGPSGRRGVGLELVHCRASAHALALSSKVRRRGPGVGPH